MSIDSLISNIVDQGILGVLLVVVGIAYYRKDKLVTELQEKRLEMADKVFKIVETLNDLLEKNGGKDA